MIFENDKIEKMLPQKEPSKFVESITCFDGDSKTLVARQNFPIDSYFLKGHFPNNPIIPGVLLIECMAQSALLLLSLLFSKKVNLGYLVKTENFKFFNVVRPSTNIEINVTLEKQVGSYFYISGVIYNLEEQKKVAKGKIVLFM